MFKRLPVFLRYILYYRRQKAIDILINLRERYFNLSGGFPGMGYWARNVTDVIEKYIGPDSQLREGVKIFMSHYDRMATADLNNDIDTLTSIAHNTDPESMINECIDHIESNGVYKGKGNNILGTLTNSELFTLLVTIGIALFGGAFSMGLSYASISKEFSNDKRSTTVPAQQKNDSLRSSISIPKSGSTTNKLP